MSEFGLFEGAVAEEYNTPLRIQAHRANVQETLKEIVATFGAFLRNSQHRDDYFSRVALVQSDIDRVIAGHRLGGRDRSAIMRALADYAEREDPVDKDDSHNPGIQVPWGKEKVDGGSSANNRTTKDKTEDARLEHVAAKKGVGRRTADWYGGDDSYDPVQGLQPGDYVHTDIYAQDDYSGQEIPPGAIGHVVEVDGDQISVDFDGHGRAMVDVQDLKKEGASKTAAWAWDPDSNSYKSSNNKFACSCGHEIEGIGQHHCRCGKVYNMSSIFNASKTATGAPMYACREVETSDKLVLAKKANNSGANMGNRRHAAGGLPTGPTTAPTPPPAPAPPAPTPPPVPSTPPAASAPPPPPAPAAPTNFAPSPAAPPVPSTPPPAPGGMDSTPAPTTKPLFNGGGGGPAPAAPGAQADPFGDQGGFGFQSPTAPVPPAAPKRDPRGKGMVPDYSAPGPVAPTLLDKAKNFMGLPSKNPVSPLTPTTNNPFAPQQHGFAGEKPLNMSDKLYNTLMGSGLEPSEFLKEHYDDLLTLYDGYENMHDLMSHGASVKRASGIGDFPPPKKDSDDDSVKHLFADPGPEPRDSDVEGDFKKSTVSAAKKLRANAAVWPLINDKDLQNNWKSLLGIITDPTQVHALEDGDYQQLVQDLYDELRYRGLGTPDGGSNSRLPDPTDPNGMMGGGGLGAPPAGGQPPAGPQHGQPPHGGGQPPHGGQPPTPGQGAHQQMATPPGQPGQDAGQLKKSPSMLAYRKGFRLARKGWAPLKDEPIEVMAGWVIGLDRNLREKTAVEDPYANRSTVYDGSEPPIPGIPVSRDDLVDGSNVSDPTQEIRQDFARDTDRRDEQGQSVDEAANHPEDFTPKPGLSTEVRHVDVLGRDSKKG